MDAIFLGKIERDYPDLVFKPGERFSFRPPKTIIFEPAGSNLLLLHELGHALSRHKTFNTGVKRLKMEVEAWEKAKELAPIYGVEVDEDLIETELDTYRNWLFSKSRCKKCGLTCYQTPDGKFHCPKCENL